MHFAAEKGYGALCKFLGQRGKFGIFLFFSYLKYQAFLIKIPLKINLYIDIMITSQIFFCNMVLVVP